MGLIVEHGGKTFLGDLVLLDDDDGDTCWTCILLGTCIDAIILAYINGVREEVGRHIGAKRHGNIGSLDHLGTIDGIVGAIVEIIDISWYSEALGDIGEVLVLGTCYNLHLADKLGLLDGIGSPCTGLEISSLGLQQIERHHIELEAGATAEEEDLIALGNIEQLLYERISLVDNSLEFLRSV